jgi:hypothetical protein
MYNIWQPCPQLLSPQKSKPGWFHFNVGNALSRLLVLIPSWTECHHRNLRSRTSMLAQVLQIFGGKEHLVKNLLISTLDKLIYYQGTFLQGSAKPLFTTQNRLETSLKMSVFFNMRLLNLRFLWVSSILEQVVFFGGKINVKTKQVFHSLVPVNATSFFNCLHSWQNFHEFHRGETARETEFLKRNKNSH